MSARQTKRRARKAPEPLASNEPLWLTDARDAATRARGSVVEALSLLGGESDPRGDLCEALAYLDTVLRELPDTEGEVTS